VQWIIALYHHLEKPGYSMPTRWLRYPKKRRRSTTTDSARLLTLYTVGQGQRLPTARLASRATDSLAFLSIEILQQRPGLPEVGRVKAPGESTVDFCQDLAGFGALALASPQPTQAYRRP
jgi:hypothetical protein